MRLLAFCSSLFVAIALSASAQTRSAVLPADVLNAVQALAPQDAATFCRRPDLRGFLGRQPPARIFGFTSRMSNVASVEGARDVEDFVAAVSQAAGYAVVSRDAGIRRDMMDVLTHWAGTGALLQTRSCTSGGRLLESCTEWTVPDGSDLSASKDFSAVQMAVSSLQRSYYLAAADFETAERAAQHQVIQNWFAAFNDRMKTPSNVYFGLQMGWHWPAIDAAVAEGRTRQAASLTRDMLRGLDPLILGDGSIHERTTRGNRALWYHNSSLNETLHSFEMARALGIAPSANLEARLHAAVNLFIRSVVDPTVIDPWAAVAHNAIHTPGVQDWNPNWRDTRWGGSW
jgi:hypothetical protein